MSDTSIKLEMDVEIQRWDSQPKYREAKKRLESARNDLEESQTKVRNLEQELESSKKQRGKLDAAGDVKQADRVTSVIRDLGEQLERTRYKLQDQQESVKSASRHLEDVELELKQEESRACNQKGHEFFKREEELLREVKVARRQKVGWFGRADALRSDISKIRVRRSQEVAR
jgi:chromosome segregation ATPase